MSKADFDITVIVTAHQEGRLAQHTMRSILRAIRLAERAGIRCQVIAVLDNPSDATVEFFSRHYTGSVHIEKVSCRDPGLARNHGIRLAAGRYVALVDADDLFGSTWLLKAFRLAESCVTDCVFYPEYVVTFEDKQSISRYLGSSDPGFDMANMFEFNCWNSVHYFVKKSLLLDNLYQASPIDCGFGYEDWHWYCEIVAKGIEVKTVPESCVFYRKKNQGSRLSMHAAHHVMCRPSRLFDYDVFLRLCRSAENSPAAKPSMVARAKARFLTAIETRIRSYPTLIPPVAALLEIARRLRRKQAQVPDWLMEEWKLANTIDPQIFPDRNLLQTIEVYEIPSSRIGRHYLELCELYGKDVSHVFLIPWLKRGGSDLVTINYVKALVENRFATGVTVIADLNSDSPWADKLPAGVNFIEFGRMYPHLSEEEKEKLLSKLLVQMAPQVIHNINSDLGYRVFTKYGKALKTVSNLYATVFCAEYSEEGKLVGYPFTYVPRCYDHLRALLSENRAMLDQLQELYSLDKNLYVHYTPTGLPAQKEYVDRVGDKKRLDILWAGRIDRQKRPDVLIEIARKCSGLPFKFHVYGTSLLSSDIYTRELKALPNVAMYGSFDGISSLPVENFDVLLFTSQWEGLPTTLIDMISLGLPIIASKVGGIPELIIDNETGYLIDPYDDAELFVQCLKNLYNDRSDLPRLLDNAYNLVASRHSWGNFLADIRQTPGYISNQPQHARQ